MRNKERISANRNVFNTFCDVYCNFINSADYKDFARYANLCFTVGFHKPWIREDKNNSEISRDKKYEKEEEKRVGRKRYEENGENITSYIPFVS